MGRSGRTADDLAVGRVGVQGGMRKADGIEVEAVVRPSRAVMVRARMKPPHGAMSSAGWSKRAPA